MFDFLGGALFEESMDFGNINTDDYSEEMNYLESVEAIHPTDDLDDAMARIAMETVENFYAIANAVTVDEFVHYVQTNEQVVYEEGRISQVCDSIKKFISNAWAKAKGIFESAIDFIESKVRNDKKFVEKYRKDLKPSSTVTLKTNIASMTEIRNDSSLFRDLTDAFTTYTRDLQDINGFNLDRAKKNGENFDSKEALSKIRGKVIGKGGESVSLEDFNNYIKEKYEKKKNVDLKIDAAKALDELEKAKESKEYIKMKYKEAQVFFAKALADANKMKKYAIKSSSKKEAKEAGVMKVVGQWNSVCRGCIAMAFTIQRRQIKAINTMRSAYRAAIVKMTGGEEPEVTNNSASLIESIEFI